MSSKTKYSEAIRLAQYDCLKKDKDVFIIGQGVWSPWYVGNTMKNLDNQFGKNRIIDTPVSESAVTGCAIGASIFSKKPIVVHPRMDFMMYAMDAIVNHAAKWKYIFAGQSKINVTIRALINRGGEQGAQHSQALHSMFSHVPGLVVAVPYSVSDAYNMLVSSININSAVIFIEDRWLYDNQDFLIKRKKKIFDFQPEILVPGHDVTIVSFGYGTHLALKSEKLLLQKKISAEIIDLKILNPIKINNIVKSVAKTGRLVCIDVGWGPCSISSEIISLCMEKISSQKIKSRPCKITLPFCPAPTSKKLEKYYYFTEKDIYQKVSDILLNE